MGGAAVTRMPDGGEGAAEAPEGRNSAEMLSNTQSYADLENFLEREVSSSSFM